MDTKTVSIFNGTGVKKAEQQICPVCRSNMAIVDQRNECGSLFVWYECARSNCDGQWLKKILK